MKTGETGPGDRIGRRLGLLLFVVIVVIGCPGLSSSIPAAASSHSSAKAAVKKCHHVTKKIHGKKKRVKVCVTVKPTPAPTATSTPIPSSGFHILATIPCHCGGNMTFAFGSLWVNRDVGSHADAVTRIDPATNTVTATIKVAPEGGEGITSGFGSIWEVDYGAGTVERIDPATNTVIATISTNGTSPAGVIAAEGAIWVANHNEPPVDRGFSVVKIDPTTNKVVDTILVGGVNGGPVWLLYSAGSVWAWDQVDLTIDRIDPASDKIVAAIPSGNGGEGANRHFAGDGSRVWYTSGLGVEQVDPTTNKTSVFFPMADAEQYGMTDMYDLQYGDGSLWIPGPCGQLACLLRVNADTGQVISHWAMASGDPSNPGFDGGLYEGGTLWMDIGPPDNQEIVQVDTTGQ